MSANSVTGVTVEQLGSKQVNTKFGTKDTYSFKAGGQWYKTGFKNSGVKAGDVISFDFSPGSYGNEVVEGSIGRATAATPAPTAAPAAAPSPASRKQFKNGDFPIDALDGQRSIIRQNALTNAREVFVATKGGKPFALDIEADAKLITMLAKQFEAYTAGDADMAAAVASVKNETAH